MSGALSKEIENRRKMSKNSCLSWMVIFFGRKKKCVGAGISGGEPPWAHEAGGAPRGVGRALHPRGQVLAPPAVFSVPDILKILEKTIFHFQGIWRTFIFGVFLYCMDKSENRQKNTIFLLYFN